MPALLLLAIAFTLPSCSSGGNSSAADSANTHDMHADNDIAMTMRSIIDAISVGQPLDSAEYNFRGTLTDGTGRPLYTDIQGTPGEWEIRIIGNDRAVIRNLYLGDLLPEELTQYILSSLQIPDSALTADGTPATDFAADIRYYDFESGLLIFETKEAQTPDGEKGPLLNIAIRKK